MRRRSALEPHRLRCHFARSPVLLTGGLFLIYQYYQAAVKRAPPIVLSGVLFAENSRLVWRRRRVERVGDIDEGPRLVDQESPPTEVIFPLGLHREFDGAAAVGVGSSGFRIDEQTAAHDYRGFSGTVARRASAD